MTVADELDARPVLLIHDMWLHATSLDPWIRLLGEHGRGAVAPGWPGERASVAETWAHIGSRPGPPVIGLTDLVDHYEAAARGFHTRPVVIGHGFGALVAEVLLARGVAWAVAAIEPAVIRGSLPLSWPQLVAATLVLGARGTRSRWVALSQHQFGLTFGTALSPSSVADLHRRWSIPSPTGPLIDAATGAARLAGELTGARPSCPPHHHLVVTGDLDRLAPGGLVRTNLPSARGTPVVRRVPGRGHSLVIDDGWLDVAHPVLTWLNGIDRLPQTPREGSPRVAVRQAAT